MQDLLAPFFIFIKINFESHLKQNEEFLSSGEIEIISEQSYSFGWSNKNIATSSIIIDDNKIKSFSTKKNSTIINVQCDTVN
jgi:hypothetical protein